ncbi:expansin-like B1 [Impatiens glandulifera]|uniref:expansin-like B1 n=1 Tax=Impatiens glandulifera TaxID=253017 RepID=UPI001FB10F5E|nr:expansin-like B1 [Impatiens glandulifera]
MVKSNLPFCIAFLTLLLVSKRFRDCNAATCNNNCFTRSRAVYYPNSDEEGTETGACGFGKYGARLNNGLVSAASNLFRNGVGCGACYEVKCTNKYYCSDKGVTVAITDHGYSGNADFILSRKAFRRMAANKHSAESILAFGIVNVEYRRVACTYDNKNITIKIDENSDYPYYLAFVLRYQQGKKDITAVQICEVINNEIK